MQSQNEHHHHRSWSTGTRPQSSAWAVPSLNYNQLHVDTSLALESPTVSPTMLQQPTVSPTMIFNRAAVHVQREPSPLYPSALPSRSVSPPAPPVERGHQRSATISSWPVSTASKRTRTASPESEEDDMKEASVADEDEDSEESRLKRSRCAQACEPCRKRKVKCRDGVPCHRCRKLKKDCVFADTPTAQQRVANARSRAITHNKDVVPAMLNPNVPMRPGGSLRIKVRKTKKSPSVTSPTVPQEPSVLSPLPTDAVATNSAPATAPIPLPVNPEASPMTPYQPQFDYSFPSSNYSALGVSLPANFSYMSQSLPLPQYPIPPTQTFSPQPTFTPMPLHSPQPWNAAAQPFMFSPQTDTAAFNSLSINAAPTESTSLAPTLAPDSASPSTSRSASSNGMWSASGSGSASQAMPFNMQMSAWNTDNTMPWFSGRRASSELTAPTTDLRTPLSADGLGANYLGQMVKEPSGDGYDYWAERFDGAPTAQAGQTQMS